MKQQKIGAFRSTSDDDSEDRIGVLGRFEEIVLMAAIACGPRSAAAMIQQRLEMRLGVQRTQTTMMTTLDRLSKKGMLASTVEGVVNSTRGGRRRRLFTVTSSGRDIVTKSLTIITDMAKDAGLVEGEENRAA